MLLGPQRATETSNNKPKGGGKRGSWDTDGGNPKRPRYNDTSNQITGDGNNSKVGRTKSRKGKAKGDGKKGKTKSDGSAIRAPPVWCQNWALQVNGKKACHAYHLTGSCTRGCDCPFDHAQCVVLKSNMRPCSSTADKTKDCPLTSGQRGTR